MNVLHARTLKMYSRPGESEASFRGRLTHALHEKRDAALEKLRTRYQPKLEKLQLSLERAQEKLDREASQYSSQKAQTAISIGETLLGALFGRKKVSVGNIGKATRTARHASRASRERGDVKRAREQLQETKKKLGDLEAELRTKTDALRAEVDASGIELSEHALRLRKSDTTLERFALAWRPANVVGA